MEQKERKGYVYALLDESKQEVKIGFTCDEIETRKRAVESFEHASLRTLYVVPVLGPRTIESRLHEHYAALRTKGEWFRYQEGLFQDFPAQAQRIADVLFGPPILNDGEAMHTLARRLQARRKYHGWTLEELAARANVPCSVLADLESGTNVVLTVWNGRRIARALAVGLDYLIDTFN